MEQRYYYDTIGSWISPETSSSSAGGARGTNQDGSAKSEGVFDDGTSIWGNPSSKKVGVDWAEKESLMNPPAKPAASNHEKRIVKPDPISSLNGTEAWGVPVNNNLNLNGQGNNQYDLNKQMSANYSNKPLESSLSHTRPPSSSASATTNHNNNPLQQHQSQNSSLESAAYSPANPSSASASASSSSSTPATATSSTQDLLKQMVHQIQLAVKAGHLNAHIMNQPMSTTTLQLVYQLLQQIETMHQLQEIQQRAGVKQTDIGSPSNLDIQINRVRQNISLLQKAITQQQAAVTRTDTIGDNSNQMKQQQQQQAANNHSYATVSKLSTNMKVPLTNNNNNNNMSNISNTSGNNSGSTTTANTNMDSFRRSSLIDTLSNSNTNSDSLRSAQATFNANATIDKTLSSILQASSANSNILRNNNNNKTITASNDFSKAHGFTNSNNVNQHHLQQQQSSNKGLLQAQSLASSSSSTSGWSAFSSGELISQQAWPSQQQQPQQSRISSATDHQQLFSAFDSVPNYGQEKTWRGSSILTDIKDNSSPFSSSSSHNNNSDLTSAAPGSGLGGVSKPSSVSNTLKKLNDKDILNSTHDSSSSSLFCDWSNNSHSGKRNFDQSSSAISSSAAIGDGGLSLQSNPWMFGASSSTLSDWMNSKNSISGGNLNINNSNKMDNGNTDKMVADRDSLFFQQSTNNIANPHRSSSGLYNWSDQVPSSTHQQQQQHQLHQFDQNSSHLNKQLQQQQASILGASSSSSGVMSGGRPAPPPGLIGSNFNPVIVNSSSSNGISLLDSNNTQLGDSNRDHERPLQSRESSNLWSGNWFD